MGYFDVQVNGYGGVDFNSDELSAEQLHDACQRLQEDGVDGILATLITADIDVLCARLQRLVALREADELARRVIAGIHIEGPFINPTDGFRGAHPLHAVKPANVDDMQRLLDAAAGLTRIVTLAPECDAGLKVTRMLADRGVIVSAGHADPSCDQLSHALDAGLAMFTHLGNGCPATGMNRHDNIIQRALSFADRAWICFIADGVHVPFFALGNYLKVTGLDCAIVTSDAVAPAGLGPGRYTLGEHPIIIGDDLVARAPDGIHLAGSAIAMPKAEQNLTQYLGLSEADAKKLTAENPRRALGL